MALPDWWWNEVLDCLLVWTLPKHKLITRLWQRKPQRALCKGNTTAMEWLPWTLVPWGSRVICTSLIQLLLMVCELQIEQVPLVPEQMKHSAILPKETHVPKLNSWNVLEKVAHRGRTHMLCTPHRHYWTPHANAAARKVIRECIVCQKQLQKPGKQKMSDLSIDRISADRPSFTHVGVDYFGPIEVKIGRSFVKRYGILSLA